MKNADLTNDFFLIFSFLFFNLIRILKKYSYLDIKNV